MLEWRMGGYTRRCVLPNTPFLDCDITITEGLIDFMNILIPKLRLLPTCCKIKFANRSISSL